MHKIGIGVINYNRANLLENLLISLKHTVGSIGNIIVADDGSTDNSLDVCKKLGVKAFGKKNMGIAWNKNRALYYFMNYTNCSQVILIENDCFIKSEGWLEIWYQSIEKWGHINCLHPSVINELENGRKSDYILSGQGTVDEPYACTKISGICIGTRRDALEKVGYLDTRFKGYGHEHSEWTLRFRRIGLGMKEVQTKSGLIKCNLMISGGLSGMDVPSSSDKQNLEINRVIMDECKSDSLYRYPWRSDEEKCYLLNDFDAIY